MTTLRATHGVVQVEAHLNGRPSASVNVFRQDEAGHFVIAHTDCGNIVSDRVRRALLAKLPEELRDDARAALATLAAQAATQVREDGKDDAAPEQFAAEDPWPVPVDGAGLLSDLTAVINRYVIVSPAAAVAIALWLVATYATAATYIIAYLLVRSPLRECGKTTLLRVLQHLAYRAITADGITAAALFRIVDAYLATVLIDELDTIHGERGEALSAVLNSGDRRDGKTPRCVGENNALTWFKTYGPKVLTLSRGARLPDTTESRCIPIRMERAAKAEVEQLQRIRGDRIGDELLPLRRQMLRWTQDNMDALREADPDMPAELSSRQADVWRLLFAIADAAGGEWPAKAREAAGALHRAADPQTDYSVALLEDMRDLLMSEHATGWTDEHGGPQRAIASTVAVEQLVQMEHRPWPEVRDGRPLTTRGVAKLLARFKVEPKTIRLGSGRAAPTLKGYRGDELAPAFARYLPPLEGTAAGDVEAQARSDDDTGPATSGPAAESPPSLFSDDYEADEREGMCNA